MKRFAQFHSRSRHHGSYDFPELIKNCPELKTFVALGKSGVETIDFSNPAAVKALNVALLKTFYGVQFWDIPENYLCPPIPGRAEYIHQIADLIKESTNHKDKITCLDIGVGANCIYPIVAASQYKWFCIGAESDPIAFENATKIANGNDFMKKKVEIRLQTNPNNLYAGIIKKNERIDVVICNPPFYRSHEEAVAATTRKNKNLHKGKVEDQAKNFGGQNGELFCEGGESRFITRMIKQSPKYAKNVGWFTSLVSQEAHLKKLNKVLKEVNPKEVKIIEMLFGNKKSRILAWRF